MSRYYPDYSPEVGNMLLNIEAKYPKLVSDYLAYFGLDRLPQPFVKENNSRAYQCWNLQAVDADNDGVVDHYMWIDTFVPNNDAGYTQALTSRWSFAQEAPEGKFDADGKRLPQRGPKPKANADAGTNTE